MKKVMQKSPTLIVFVALLMQVSRVAAFGEAIQSGTFLAGVFAFFLAGSIFVLAYFDGLGEYVVTAKPEDERSYKAQMKQKATREVIRRDAVRWLFVFLLADGGINLAQTMSELPQGVTTWQYVFSLVYGVLPTLAAWGFGRMQGAIDKLAIDGKTSAWDEIFAALVDWLKAALAPKEKPVAADDNRNTVKLTNDAMLAHWRQDPRKTDAAIAQAFGVTRQAVQLRRKKLVETGVISYDSKQGVKVLS